jgi:hypothetical protein
MDACRRVSYSMEFLKRLPVSSSSLILKQYLVLLKLFMTCPVENCDHAQLHRSADFQHSNEPYYYIKCREFLSRLEVLTAVLLKFQVI